MLSAIIANNFIVQVAEVKVDLPSLAATNNPPSSNRLLLLPLLLKTWPKQSNIWLFVAKSEALRMFWSYL